MRTRSVNKENVLQPTAKEEVNGHGIQVQIREEFSSGAYLEIWGV